VQDLALRVSSVRKETPSTRIVRLDLDGKSFAYKAGQAATIGPADRDDRVPYSIASAPAETARSGSLEFLIKLHADGLWGNDFELPRPAASLRLHGPAGRFVLPDRPTERRFLFIAGGTGIAPLRSIMREAILTRRAPPMRLLYSARTPADFSYLKELRQMMRRRELEMKLTATRESTSRWRGGRGRITAEQLAPLVDDPATLCFVCGPAAMVADVPVILRDLGIAEPDPARNGLSRMLKNASCMANGRG
jgi:NAD(P)H-flavin reductase